MNEIRISLVLRGDTARRFREYKSRYATLDPSDSQLAQGLLTIGLNHQTSTFAKQLHTAEPAKKP